jgi:hypothetical protein
MRKQAGMTVLATIFDSLRGFLKIIGRKRLFFIQTRVPDGTMVRVAGAEYTGVVQVTKDKTTGTYDVVVDDAPTSPNMKEANWAVMQPLLTIFKDQLSANPELLLLALEYSPLPTPFVDAMKKAMAQKTDPNQQQFQETMKQLAISKLTAEINKDQSTAEMQNAKAGATNSTATYDLAMAQNLLAKNDIQGVEHHISAMSASAKAELDRANAAKAVADAHQKMQQGQMDQTQHTSDMVDALHSRAMDRHQTALDTAGLAVDHQKALTDRLHAHIAARQQTLDAAGMLADHTARQQEMQQGADQAAGDQQLARGDQQLKAQGLQQQDEHNQRQSAIARIAALAGAARAVQPSGAP